MSTDLKMYDPAAWHDGGLVRVSIRDSEEPRHARGPRRPMVSAFVVTFALATSALFVADDRVALSIDPNSAASAYGAVDVAPRESLQSPDEVDPSVWGRLIAHLETLPRNEIIDPDDVEPFV